MLPIHIKHKILNKFFFFKFNANSLVARSANISRQYKLKVLILEKNGDQTKLFEGQRQHLRTKGKSGKEKEINKKKFCPYNIVNFNI